MAFFLKNYVSRFFILTLIILHSHFALAVKPFRLLTMETATNPEATVVAGFQELGFVTGPVFIDTNPLLLVANTANLAGKFVFNVMPDLQMTLGTRYFKLLESSTLEGRAKENSTLISKFQLNYSGFASYAGATYNTHFADFHFNVQSADISGSKIFGVVLGTNFFLNDTWSLIAEGGYEFANKQPRASFGIARHGPVFGFKFGATYVELNDPVFNYKGPIPVLDFYWLFGGNRKVEK